VDLRDSRGDEGPPGGRRFTEVETWLTEGRTPFGSRAELETFLTTVLLWPQLAVRPPSEHMAFVARVADELPGVELDYVRLNMRARHC